MEISTEHGVRVDIAVAHRSVGEVYAELGEFPAAIQHQEQFLKISEEIEDLLEQQRAHATLGRTYYTKLMSESDERVVAETRKKAGHCYISALKLTDVLRAKRLSTEKEIMEVGNLSTIYLHVFRSTLFFKTNCKTYIFYLIYVREIVFFCLDLLYFLSTLPADIAMCNVTVVIQYKHQPK